MIKEKIVSAKTEEQARTRVGLEFGIDGDKLNCELVEAAKKGIFGFGAQDAKYRLSYDDGTPEPVKSQPHNSEVKKAEARPAKQAAAKSAQPKAQKETADSLDSVISFINTILSDMKLNAEAKVNSQDNEDVYIEIVGENLGAIIGHHGEVLDSIQYLSNIINDNDKGESHRIHIDVENYRAKREETLNKLADRMAAKVLSNGRSVTLEPMNPYERRIIHSRIQGIEGVTTRSVGTDLGRKVVISLEKGSNSSAGYAKDDKYKVQRPEYSGSEGRYDRYTAPSDK